MIVSGEMFDSGHCLAAVESVFGERSYGVKLNPLGHGVMSPRECRQMAAYLILTAEYCEKLNSRLLPTEATDGR